MFTRKLCDWRARAVDQPPRHLATRECRGVLRALEPERLPELFGLVGRAAEIDGRHAFRDVDGDDHPPALGFDGGDRGDGLEQGQNKGGRGGQAKADQQQASRRVTSRRSSR